MSKSLFYIDSIENRTKSYDDLLNDVNSTKSYNSYFRSNSYYSVFLNIIVSILLEKEIIILDNDFSEKEIEILIGFNDLETKQENLTIEEIDKLQVNSIEELLKKINNVDYNWKISLFTSGTTGLPKKVSHTFETITRFVKRSTAHLSDVWGFAYNPTHIAGIQVFFQALLNQNLIIRLFGLSQTLFFEQVEKFQVSHISATPTFFRLIYSDNLVLPSVKHITIGGEKLDKKIVEKLKLMMPDASFTNVYASTEAGSLFASKDDAFIIKEEFKNMVKVEKFELLINKCLLAQSDDLKLAGEWYHTGDIVEIMETEPLKIRFISRKNEMINVGGYKVNPAEVEDAIRSISGVSDVRVYAKPNSVLGNLICCEIVSVNDEVTEKRVRLYLTEVLQDFKIPRLIHFVDRLDLTRTGKVIRN